MPRAAWLLVPTLAAAAVPWAADELRDVTRPPCGQAFRVCDPDGYLKDASGLEKAIVALEADYEYPDCGGYEMGVVIVGSLRHESAEQFAKRIMDFWGVGKSACNNGIVLVMAIQDRELFIATGRGAKKFIPDSELREVVDRMKPLMRAGRYADAAEQCVSDIARILDGESFRQPAWPFVLSMLGIGGFVSWSCVRGRRRQREYERCKRMLMEIDRQRSQARANQYQQTSCAICLESFRDTEQLQVETLHCGHKFHHTCISSWEDRSGTCPICRQSTTDPLGTRPSAAPGSQTSSRRPFADSMYEDEYRFRLRRAHHYYPRYVSDSMLDRWSNPNYHGQPFADAGFIRSSPNYVAPGGSSSGGHGGRSSFGGGCSSGGGGAGGSW